MPKLSIITVNLNNKIGLEKTIESVISQTFTDYEFIILDGTSTDGSAELLEKYKKKITYGISEKDSGIYNAMNKGLTKANGDYCLFLNSGDYLIEDNILSKVFSSGYSEDILYGELIFDFGNNNRKIIGRPEKIKLPFLFNDNIWHPACFIKRTLFRVTGMYNEKYKIAADYDFFFHAIIRNKVSTKYLPFPISVYDTSGISSQGNNFKKINDERAAIHNTYLSKVEITFLNFKNKLFSLFPIRYLVNVFERIIGKRYK